MASKLQASVRTGMAPIIAYLVAIAFAAAMVAPGGSTWPNAAAFVFALVAGVLTLPSKVEPPSADNSERIKAIEDDIKNLRSALALKR